MPDPLSAVDCAKRSAGGTRIVAGGSTRNRGLSPP